MRQDNARDRFYSKVQKTETCWLWKGGVAGAYGTFSLDGRAQGAHRAAWQIEHGPIPDGLVVRHICDVKLCVRIDHLTLGTSKDNAADATARGRRNLRRKPGHITQRSPGSWRVVVSAGLHPDGRRRYVTRTVRGSRADAQEALNRVLVEVADGLHHAHPGSLEHLLTRWLAHSRPDLSPRTAESYEYLIRTYIEPTTLGGRPFGKIRTVDLDQLYTTMRDQKGLSPATIRKVHNIIHRAYKQGIRWQWCTTNPAASASPPAVRSKRITVPEPATVAALLAAAGTDEFGVFLRVAAATGARRGEICGLQWRDIDWSSSSMTIERSVIAVTGHLIVKSTKTDAARTISLDDFTARALQSLRIAAQERLLVLGLTLEPTMFVFPADVASQLPVRPDVVTHRFLKLCRSQGAHGVRLHDLRHFHVTQLLGNGVDIGTVADRVGHKNAMMTLNLYRHFMPPSDQRAAALIGRVLGS